MRAGIDERLVDGMDLIRIVGSFVGKNKRQRKIVRVVNDRASGFSGCADVSGGDVADALQRSKASTESRVIIPVFGVFEPEKYSMNKHRLKK